MSSLFILFLVLTW